jgi:predicted dehydrogenase/ribosomal protein S18 acetylase RimI-like enzyme
VSQPPILRVGIAGRRGASTAAGLEAEGARVTALCELDPAVLERMGRELEVPPERRFTRFEDMLAAGIDAVVVGTPMQLHAPQCIAALEAGKHALSEVTAAVSLSQCADLLRAARRAARRGLVYMLAENYCYRRQNVLVRALVGRGDFGDPYYGEGEYIHDVKELHHHPDGSPTWRARWQVGVNGCTYPTHSLGPVMQWFGRERIAHVVCLGSGVHTDPEHVMEDSVDLLCKLESGRLARVRLDMLSNRPHATANYTLQGTAGSYESARAPGEPDRIWLRRLGEVRWHDLQELDGELPQWYREGAELASRSGHGGADFFVARDFVRACRGEIAVPIPIEDALQWTMAGLCSQESIARGGMPIPVPPLTALDPGERSAPPRPAAVRLPAMAPPAVLAEGGAVPAADAAAPAGPRVQEIATAAVASPGAGERRGPQLVMRAPASLPLPEVPVPSGYAVRRAGLEDLAAVARCMALGFGDWDAERVRRELLQAPDVQATFLAVETASGLVVACASHREVPDRFPGATYLHYVAADPAHSGRRLGALVSAAVLAFGRAEGHRDAVLETDDHRLPAIATYLGLGFAPEYRDPGHPARWAAIFRHLASSRRGVAFR